MAKRTTAKTRIQSLEYLRASEIIRNPDNWRTHPEDQKSTLRAIIDDVGYVSAVLVRKVATGYELLDGHLRADISGDEFIPALVLDLTDKEVATVLATYDPVGDLAGRDEEALNRLLEKAQIEARIVEQLLGIMESDVATTSGSEVVPVEVKDPPKMAWVLIGIPTVQFGSIAEVVEGIAAIPDTIIETTVT